MGDDMTQTQSQGGQSDDNGGRTATGSEYDPTRHTHLRNARLHVLDQLVRLLHFIVAQVVDDQVELGLGQVLHQGRQHLQRIVAVAEDDEVVANEVRVINAHVLVGERLELCLGGFACSSLQGSG